jgi:hypothetical protein
MLSLWQEIRRSYILSALFFRRCMYVDEKDDEPMFYRMSRHSYHRKRKLVRAHRKEIDKWMATV